MIVVLAACSLPSLEDVYTQEEVIECLSVPILTAEVFDQNQHSTKEYSKLYAYYDMVKNLSTAGEGKADIAAELEAIDQAKDQYVGQPAYKYFYKVASVFQALKDAHTLFIKPSFFSIFNERLPFTPVQNDDLTWYVHELADSDKWIADKALAKGMAPDLAPLYNKHITAINGMEPVKFFEAMAKKYIHDSRSEHGRFNYYANQYALIQDVRITSMLDQEDTTINVTIEGTTYNFTFCAVVNTTLISDAAANQAYLDCFTEQARAARKRLEIKPRYSKLQESDTLKASNLEVLYKTKEDFFVLYKYNSDYILHISTFYCEYYYGIDAIAELGELLHKLDFTNAKFFFSLTNNGGGYTDLQTLMTHVFLPNEYPIFSRNRVRSNPVMDKFEETGIMNEIAWFADWKTSEPKEMTYFYEPSSTSNQSKVFCYRFYDSEQLTESEKRIYRLGPLKINPENVFFVSDGTCGSACAVVLKRLRLLNFGRIISLGGTDNTDAPFETGAFSGASVGDTIFLEQIYQNSSDPYFANLAYKHNGYMRYADIMVYDSRSNISDEQLQTPLEFVVIPPDFHIHGVHVCNALPPDQAIMHWIDRAVELVKSESGKWYGAVCKQENNIEYRELNGECVKFTCSYGYMREGQDFTCVRRVDPWLQYRESGLSIEQIVGIVIGSVLAVAAVAAVIVLAALYFKKKKTRSNHKFRGLQEPQIAEDELVT